MLAADEGGAVAAEEHHLVDAEPDGVAQRIGDDENEENENGQGQEQRELQIRELSDPARDHGTIPFRTRPRGPRRAARAFKSSNEARRGPDGPH